MQMAPSGALHNPPSPIKELKNVPHHLRCVTIGLSVMLCAEERIRTGKNPFVEFDDKVRSHKLPADFGGGLNHSLGIGCNYSVSLSTLMRVCDFALELQ